MRTLIAIVCLFGCSRPAPVKPPSNTVEAAPVVDAAEEVEEEEPSQCVRYGELSGKAAKCTALSEEARQDLERWDIDMLARVSESGMDGSSPVDEEALCEKAADHIIKVAKEPCGL
jgi:hypothetical protein